MTDNAAWPKDADGDVMRRLQEQGFDFAVSHKIDFYIDFTVWPPSHEAIAQLKSAFGDIEVSNDNHDIAIHIRDFVTYEFVTGLQAEISRKMLPFGGVCEGLTRP